MSQVLRRLCLVALFASVPALAWAETTGVAELLRLLKSGVGEPVARAWLEKAELTGPPTTDQLIELKAAGASDELLVELVRKSVAPPQPARHTVRRVQRVDQRTGRRFMELTNQAEDGSFPPPPPAPQPKPRSEAPPAPPPQAAIPSMIPQPVPVFIDPPVRYTEPPVRYLEPRRSTGTLRIIPPRSARAFWGANPPGHHFRFFGPDGYHFPRSEELYRRRPTIFVFDFEIPFFRFSGPGPHQSPGTGFQLRPSGIQPR
jgi:hypothetical protein